MALPVTSPGDTFATMGAYVSQNANYLLNLAEAFINSMAVQSGVDYTRLGGADTLNYLQWDYDGELNALRAQLPGYITVVGGGTLATANALAATEVPAAPTLNLPSASFPSFDAERPSIALPARPSTDVGDAPTDVPSVVEPTIPDAPQITLPSVPTFEELNLPAAPSFTIPTFSAVAPIANLAAPTQQFAYVDAGYTSSLRDPLVAKLLGDLENGSYGIDTTDEDALWTRARDRAAQQGNLATEAVLKAAANTGFQMPQGALFAQLERARQDLQRTLSDANREIALKRADMYVEGRKFTIQEVQKYEQQAVALYNAVQERALNAAKYTVELGIAVYDAGVRNLQASLDVYKTEASVFESRMRAELGKAEIFKAQIQAEMLRGQFNEQRVSLYQAQLNGINAVSNLYKSRLEGANLLLQVQAQKVDIFKTRVQAYGERVRAKAAEYDMYRSAVAGETAKLDIYKADIAAFQTRVSAEESRIRALVQANEALTNQYKAHVTQYTSQLEALAKKAEIYDGVDKTLVAAQGVNVQTYRALADAIVAGTNSRVSAQRMNNDWNIATVNSRMESLKVQLQELIATSQFRAGIAKDGAKLYSDNAATLLTNLSGLNVKST